MRLPPLLAGLTVLFSYTPQAPDDFDARLNIVPDLASGYQRADSRMLMIRLRPGIKFQNGEQFDAEAVKYALERHITAYGGFRRSEIGAMDHAEVIDLSARRRCTTGCRHGDARCETVYAGMYRHVSAGRRRAAARLPP
jgi:hypothetical protein